MRELYPQADKWARKSRVRADIVDTFMKGLTVL
jgi:hypothetical protein